ncbi:hypothetical protein Tco_0985087 [Tanacetum coccineum]
MPSFRRPYKWNNVFLDLAGILATPPLLNPPPLPPIRPKNSAIVGLNESHLQCLAGTLRMPEQLKKRKKRGEYELEAFKDTAPLNLGAESFIRIDM